MDITKLPYKFDLLYDIKYMYEVEQIANGKPSSSDAEPSDLVELFLSLRMKVPHCLKGVLINRDVWLCNDGTWSFDEPMFDEKYKYIKSVIKTEQ